MIHLVMTQVLEKATEAYLVEALESQKNPDRVEMCTYSGPCAIGASLDPETRILWDDRGLWEDDTSINNIFSMGGFTIDSIDGDIVDLTTLQVAHDYWHPEDFLVTLNDLREKYGMERI